MRKAPTSARTEICRLLVRGVADEELREAVEAVQERRSCEVLDRLREILPDATSPAWMAGEVIEEAYDRGLIDWREHDAARLAAGL